MFPGMGGMPGMGGGKKKKKEPRPDLTYEQLMAAPRSTIFEVRVRQAEVLKEAANQLYTQKDLFSKENSNVEKALALYQKGISHLNFEGSSFSFMLTRDQFALVQSVENLLRVNSSKCYVRLKQLRAAIKEIAPLLSGPPDTSTAPALPPAPPTEPIEGVASKVEKPYIAPDPKLVITARFVTAKALFELEELAASETMFRELQTELEESLAAAEVGAYVGVGSALGQKADLRPDHGPLDRLQAESHDTLKDIRQLCREDIEGADASTGRREGKLPEEFADAVDLTTNEPEHVEAAEAAGEGAETHAKTVSSRPRITPMNREHIARQASREAKEAEDRATDARAAEARALETRTCETKFRKPKDPRRIIETAPKARSDHASVHADTLRYLDLLAKRRAGHKRREGLMWKGKLVEPGDTSFKVPVSEAASDVTPKVSDHLWLKVGASLAIVVVGLVMCAFSQNPQSALTMFGLQF